MAALVALAVPVAMVAGAPLDEATAAVAVARAGFLPSPGGVRLNEIQVIGTHNSYHVEASPAEKAVRAEADPVGEKTLEYGHPPLAEQLSGENVRQVELDVFADPAGGLYAKPLIRTLTGGGPYDSVMAEPGFKVLHIQDIDYRSNCLTLSSCLTQIKDWSDAHRGHVPVTVLLELMDQPMTLPGAPPLTDPVPWDGPGMDALDGQIRAVFGQRELITPDDVRAGWPTLESAVLGRGWPTLRSASGKVMFLMDNGGHYRTTYLAGHPSLRGRVLFTSSAPGQPDAAFIKENDPTGAGQSRIQAEVAAGYMVRTRADVDTVQARTGDTTQRDLALASGAQWVSTDYPVPGIAARFGTEYVAQLPGGAVVRCNPVKVPLFCRLRRLPPPPCDASTRTAAG
jgi:hypothetical protein